MKIKITLIFLTLALAFIEMPGADKTKDHLLFSARLNGYYFGGTGSDEITAVVFDSTGNYYVVGNTTTSAGLITSGIKDTYAGGATDIFLCKYSSDAKLIWSRYFGGEGTDKAFSVKCTHTGSLVICGSTTSKTGIAMSTGFQQKSGGGEDGFAALFSADGAQQWGTYIGGSDEDLAMSLAIDSWDNIYVAGSTSSSGLSTAKAYQKNLSGKSDGYVLKLNSDGSENWFTYFGGSENDSIKAITIGYNNYLNFAGSTNSVKGLVTEGCQQDTIGGLTDAFLGLMTGTSDVIWCSYYGGKKDDWANAIASDSKGNVFITGFTQSRNNITAGTGFVSSLNGGLNAGGAFVAKYSITGELMWGTYYGGSRKFDYGTGIVCDSSGSVIVTGCTADSTGIMETNGCWQNQNAGGYDAFVVKFNEGLQRIWSTYYGGEGDDFANCIAADKDNNIYIGGKTSSSGGIAVNGKINTPPDAFVSALSGDANVAFHLICRDSAAYPIKVSILKQTGQNKWSELYSTTVKDSLEFISTDIKNETALFRLRAIPANANIYNTYEGNIGYRPDILALQAFYVGFIRSNYRTDTNKISNIKFYYANNGIYGLNIGRNTGGFFWPRGTTHQYIFGSGLWFAAIKKNPADLSLKKYVIMTYNPNNGSSWMVPGRHEEKAVFDTNMNKRYFPLRSTYFNSSTGKANFPFLAPWPLWKTGSNEEMKLGSYILDTNKRNSSVYTSGPAFVSDEDIFSTYNDLDVDFYDGNGTQRKSEGYPLGLQTEQIIYSWADEAKKDAIVIYYRFINISSDTLMNCWIAPVIDYDILDTLSNKSTAATNDRGRFYAEDESQQMAIGWSNGDMGEAGKNFGYLGMSLIQTPAVDGSGFIKKANYVYPKEDQLGLVTFRNWVIADDKQTDDEKYNLLSSGLKDGDIYPGDKRALLASGPFNMLPGDTAKLALCLNLALSSEGGDPDGSMTSLAKLVGNKKIIDKFWNDYMTDIQSNNRFEDFDISYDFKPNPSSGMVNLSFSLTDYCNLEINLFTLKGEFIAEIAGQSAYEPGSYNLNLDLSHYSNGVYLLKLSGCGKTIIKKVLITK